MKTIQSVLNLQQLVKVILNNGSQVVFHLRWGQSPKSCFIADLMFDILGHLI